MNDKPIIPNTPIEKPRPSPVPGHGSGSDAKLNPLHHDPYSDRAYAPNHGAHSFPADSVNLSQHYGAPHEIKKISGAGASKGKDYFKRNIFIDKLKNRGRITNWRAKLAKKLGITEAAGTFDPRVTKQIDIIVKKLYEVSRDNLVSKNEFKKALGGLRHERFWEEMHHKQERMADGKITLKERRERDLEHRAHEALPGFVDEMLESEHEE